MLQNHRWRALLLSAVVAAAASVSCDQGGEADTGTADGDESQGWIDEGGACHYVRRSSLKCSFDVGYTEPDVEDVCVEAFDAEGCDDDADDKDYLSCEYDCCSKSSTSNVVFVAGATCSDPRPS